MTKYILHGGATGNKSGDNRKFFSETTNTLLDNATILCVYFARDKELWPKMFEQDKLNFFSATKQKIFNYVLADDKISVLKEQIKNADLIYLRGGETKKLKEILSKVRDLKNLWQDKVVAGSSAGANVLSKYYYSVSLDAVREGFGILPIKIFCHYAKEKSDKLDELKEYGEKLKVYTIPEEKFVIIKG